MLKKIKCCTARGREAPHLDVSMQLLRAGIKFVNSMELGVPLNWS